MAIIEPISTGATSQTYPIQSSNANPLLTGANPHHHTQQNHRTKGPDNFKGVCRRSSPEQPEILYTPTTPNTNPNPVTLTTHGKRVPALP